MRACSGVTFRRWFAVVALFALLVIPTAMVGAASNNFVMLQKIDDPNGAAGDEFGLAVAISKDNVYAVVSAPGIGKVWVYTRDANGQWTSPVLLPAPSPAPTSADSFGAAVAISSDSSVGNRVILVGSYTGGGTVANSGAVYAYRLTGASWATATPTRLTPAAPNASVASDEFGRSVAINATGTVALIGSPVSGGVRPGAAFVFVRSGAVWTPASPAKINPVAPATSVAGDHFGSGVALSDDGNTALIGANENNVNKHGEAYVYTGSSGNFTTASQKILSPSDGCTSPCGDFFGDTVSLSGDGKTALIGAWQHVDPVSANPTGSAYVFTNSGGTWSQTDELNEGPNNTYQDRFGWSVSLSGDGNTAAVGAIYWGSFAAGAAWAYVRSGGHFQAFGDQPIQSPDANGKPNPPSGNDAFGWSVSVPQQGTHILIGQPLHTVGGTATTGGNDFQGEAFDYALNLDLTPAAGALPAGTVGTPYSEQFTGSNGAGGPYTYAVTGTLPPGLTLAANTGPTPGVLSGTPTQAGDYSFSIGVTDPSGTTTHLYTLHINPGATTIQVANATASFSAAPQNVALTATVTASVPVNEGTVIITVMNGATLIGSSPATAVTGGQVTANVPLPAGTPAGSYAITAAYTPSATTPNFTASTTTIAGTLTISGAAAQPTTTTVSSAAAFVEPTDRSVTLSATVAATTPVNEGTVTFAVTQGATPLNAAVTSGPVTNGQASALFVVPANSAPGSYTITATYNPAATNPQFTTSNGTGTLTVTTATVTSITLSAGPASGTIKVGQTVQFTLTGTLSDGSSVNLTNQASWVSDHGEIITVVNGLVTGKSPGGPVTITVTYNGMSKQVVLSVSAPTPVGITVPVQPAPAGRPSGTTGSPVPSAPGNAPAPIPTGR